jgi:hypothetical protein
VAPTIIELAPPARVHAKATETRSAFDGTVTRIADAHRVYVRSDHNGGEYLCNVTGLVLINRPKVKK